MTTVYKVLINGRWSLNAVGVYCLEYKRGEITYPYEGTKWLCAFRSRAEAIPWTGYVAELWECEAEVLERQPDEIAAFDDEEDIARWWGGKKLAITQDPPYGTVFCKWIKPIRLLRSM